jgi:outer membrane lipoprotein carrier protein
MFRGAIGQATLVAMLMLSAAVPAKASGLAQLKAFVDGAKTGRTTFRQSVIPKGREQAQVSSGTFTFARPGRFRWSYQEPYEQLIVGDGAKLWIYDRDLNQVTTHKQDVSLGASPAALLSGDNSLDRNFEVVDAGASDGLEFVDARPRAPESGVERVRIGFRDNLPRVMELHDTFGNVTTLTFDSFERNVKLDAAQFAFVPPKGADVVGN